jgi:hypothetical protein
MVPSIQRNSLFSFICNNFLSSIAHLDVTTFVQKTNPNIILLYMWKEIELDDGFES